MNKFTLLFFLFTILGFTVNAQDSTYVPMFGEQATGWYQYIDLGEAGGKTTLKIYADGDTTANGLTYVRLMNDWYFASEDTTYTQLIGFFREDEEERKVYSLNSATSITPETVYYDFSKGEGDTLYLGSEGSTLLLIDSINTTAIVCGDTIENGNRVFHLTNVSVEEPESVTWIEGVGSIAGMQAYHYGINCELLDEALVCKITDDNIDYHFSQIPGFEECKLEVETSNQQRPEELTLRVYPNPAHSVLRISGDPTELGNARYRIFNLTGKLLKTGYLDYNRETTLDVSTMKSGAYIVEIYNAEKNLLANKKFVVAK